MTSPFGVIAYMWLVLFPRSSQVVLEPLSNARSCDNGALHDVALTRTSRI
jgi:hypothetical protein